LHWYWQQQQHILSCEYCFLKKNPAVIGIVLWCRMAPEVIACDEDPDATYDNRVSVASHVFIVGQ